MQTLAITWFETTYQVSSLWKGLSETIIRDKEVPLIIKWGAMGTDKKTGTENSCCLE